MDRLGAKREIHQNCNGKRKHFSGLPFVQLPKRRVKEKELFGKCEDDTFPDDLEQSFYQGGLGDNDNNEKKLRNKIQKVFVADKRQYHYLENSLQRKSALSNTNDRVFVKGTTYQKRKTSTANCNCLHQVVPNAKVLCDDICETKGHFHKENTTEKGSLDDHIIEQMMNDEDHYHESINQNEEDHEIALKTKSLQNTTGMGGKLLSTTVRNALSKITKDDITLNHGSKRSVLAKHLKSFSSMFRRTGTEMESSEQETLKKSSTKWLTARKNVSKDLPNQILGNTMELNNTDKATDESTHLELRQLWCFVNEEVENDHCLPFNETANADPDRGLRKFNEMDENNKTAEAALYASRNNTVLVDITLATSNTGVKDVEKHDMESDGLECQCTVEIRKAPNETSYCREEFKFEDRLSSGLALHSAETNSVNGKDLLKFSNATKTNTVYNVNQVVPSCSEDSEDYIAPSQMPRSSSVLMGSTLAEPFYKQNEQNGVALPFFPGETGCLHDKPILENDISYNDTERNSELAEKIPAYNVEIKPLYQARMTNLTQVFEDSDIISDSQNGLLDAKKSEIILSKQDSLREKDKQLYDCRQEEMIVADISLAENPDGISHKLSERSSVHEPLKNVFCKMEKLNNLVMQTETGNSNIMVKSKPIADEYPKTETNAAAIEMPGDNYSEDDLIPPSGNSDRKGFAKNVPAISLETKTA